MPLADPPAFCLSRLLGGVRVPFMGKGATSGPRSHRAVSLTESLCMMVGLGGMALALGVTVAQATLPPVPETEAALRRAVIAAGFDAAICPDGWAADHAEILPLTEAEIIGWYLSEAMKLSDAEVIASVGLYVTRARDFRQVEGTALTRNQILLCIAESRRLVTPLHERIPPELRAQVSRV